jgi:hypothetical protein
MRAFLVRGMEHLLRRRMGKHMLCNPMANQGNLLFRGNPHVVPVISTRWLI